MLTYLFWIVAALLALPALIGLGTGLALVVLAVITGLVVAGICCAPLLCLLVLVDARFWRTLQGHSNHN